MLQNIQANAVTKGKVVKTSTINSKQQINYPVSLELK